MLVKKKYIFITGFAGFISGGPIYYRNKIKYLRERGWDIDVLSMWDGQCYFPDLVQYLDNTFDFLLYHPLGLSQGQLNYLVSTICKKIDVSDYDEVVVETGTEIANIWGEAIAKALGAKHFILFLDENNPLVDQYTADFYSFKYRRGELYGITLDEFKNVFSNHISQPIDYDNCFLIADCTNSIEDYESDLASQIPQSDFNIGYIGRIEKDQFAPIAEAVAEWADRHSDIEITFAIFGGTNVSEAEEKTRNLFMSHKNVKLYISGFMFPFPRTALDKMDVFASFAGSAWATTNAGYPTIDYSMFEQKANGILINPYLDQYYECPSRYDSNNLLDMFEFFYTERPVIICGRDADRYWKDTCQLFDKHLEALHKSAGTHNYYDIGKINRVNEREKKKLVNICMMTYPLYSFLRKIYLMIKKYI